jgi:acyl-CoA dehydrogenase
VDSRILSWPFFSDGHRHLASEFGAWCESEIGGGDEEDGDVDDACRTYVQKLARAGWLRYCVPLQYGGIHERLDVRSLALIRQTLARHSGLADFAFAMQGLGSGMISLAGTEAQKSAYLPAVARGEKLAAFALTERRCGSDAAAIETTSMKTERGWILDGAKTYISNGGIADFYVVIARTGDGPGARGLSAFAVDRGSAGLDDSERIEVIAPHPLATVTFEGMELADDALIGVQGRGFHQAMATLDVFRTTVASAAVGFAERALEEATRRALSRRLGNGLLADNAVTQAKLAEMVLDLESAALLTYRAAWMRDGGESATREAALAKLDATESAQRVIDEAVQMFGGLGVTRGVPVERLYREIRALRIYEGASEVQKVIIARDHLSDFRS